jgi:hypothetical protein
MGRHGDAEKSRQETSRVLLTQDVSRLSDTNGLRSISSRAYFDEWKKGRLISLLFLFLQSQKPSFRLRISIFSILF